MDEYTWIIPCKHCREWVESRNYVEGTFLQETFIFGVKSLVFTKYSGRSIDGNLSMVGFPIIYIYPFSVIKFMFLDVKIPLTNPLIDLHVKVNPRC